MKRRLLLVNPNTTATVTQRLARHVGAVLGDAVEIDAVTAPFGPAYISTETGYAIAEHATLAAFAAQVRSRGVPDATLVGCFGDPGVFALRELCRRPVLGLAEGAMRAAARHGRYAIVTGGRAWGPMLQRLAKALALDAPLAAIETVEADGAALAADPAAAHELLGAACRETALRSGAQAIILGGAGLAGYAQGLDAVAGVPVLDSVAAATAEIAALLSQPAADAALREDLLALLA